ncbi:FtsQ-type POTRA domain-containing protein [Patescibacteria group bacterium]|nr:FtsQ-type POTRA domain-containing protein [Patescibacteria group bacterium]
MARMYRKARRIRPRKSRLRNRFFGIGLLFVILVVLLGYIFFFTGLLTIYNVEIVGAKKIEQGEVMNLVGGFIQRNILFWRVNNIVLFPIQDIEQKLVEVFPEIRSVRVEKKFPHTITVTIQERRGVAVWCRDSERQECFALDADGIVFESRNPGEFLPLLNFFDSVGVRIGENIIKAEVLEHVLDFHRRVSSFLTSGDEEIRIVLYTIVSGTRVNAETSEHWDMYINPKENIEWQVEKLRTVFEKNIPPERRGELEYIDLRFGDQAFIKYKE